MNRTETEHDSQADHITVQRSTTLNRRYVRRPTVDTAERNARIESRKKAEQKRREARAAEINRARLMAIKNHKSASSASSRSSVMSASEKKDAAVSKALRNVATMNSKSSSKKSASFSKRKFSVGRIVLAFSCAVASVIAIVYFVNLNVPDLSAQVIAMRSGIENSYPDYVPRGYSLKSSVAGDNRITLTFENSEESKSFQLVEEKSSWDSKALLANYVEPTFETYDAVREQGLTLYISGSSAAWVNSGVKYILTAANGTLTNKQIKSIAVSL
ncbi:hypothetical protein IJG76_00820 [Candidatus Saccharibacteria bacterium]|nr:hypothetical protein [Candidatus Saccharibacteria bacterium]